MSAPIQPVATTIAAEVKQEVRDIQQGEVDTVETNARYLAYAARLRNIVVANSRYLAYTSDIGESFRPVVSPAIVRASYGISIAYVGFDVVYEGYKAHMAGAPNDAVGITVVKRSIFQGLASLAAPAVTIHTVVHLAGKALKDSANVTLRRWAPTALGLAVVPALPYMFDHPIETAVDKVFEKLEGNGGKTLPMNPAHKEKVLEEVLKKEKLE
ncbi:hypothetical protein BGZ73_005408 [Actinomortierella ambigua]|nr:hypothetical protein BGZ73_005408 [Actinomortierella ambigua]